MNAVSEPREMRGIVAREHTLLATQGRAMSADQPRPRSSLRMTRIIPRRARSARRCRDCANWPPRAPHPKRLGRNPARGRPENELSLREVFRIVSTYLVGDDPGARVWIVTEADWSTMLLLLPNEY